MSSQRSNKLLDRLKLKGEREMTLVVEYPEEGTGSTSSCSGSYLHRCLEQAGKRRLKRRENQSQKGRMKGKIPVILEPLLTICQIERDQSRNSPQPFPYDDSCLARAVRMSYANEFTFGIE
ncbi:hypothetical protein RDI58_030189 [Solanum bulbocastanum]|uniref:Uncharacterized protein n=1 Tax=Solanum bulbocastanum TaxID=147425 RepID=A0AAN8XY36_SOLBU